MKRHLWRAFLAGLAVLGLVLAGLGAPVEAYAQMARDPSLGRVAYIQGGDVWVKDLPDGTPRRLTRDGMNSWPRWSPSGQWLVFSKWSDLRPNRAIPPMTAWLIRGDGSGSHALSHDVWTSNCVWAPKSDRIACTSDKLNIQGSETRVVNADGNDPVDLTELNEYYGDIVWSPDGEAIAFDCGSGVMKTSARGGKRSRLPVPMPALQPEGGPFPFRPDEPRLAAWIGSYILYWQGEGGPVSGHIVAPLYAVPVDGGKPRRLTTDDMFYRSDFIAASPDGRFLAISEGGGREIWSNKRIVMVELANGKRTMLTDKKSASYFPAWSPDGQRMAYISTPEIGDVNDWKILEKQKANCRIWIMNRDGSGKRQLTTDAGYQDERPQWSADGRQILFVRISNKEKTEDKREYQGSLWLVNAEGEEPVKVVDELSYSSWDVDFDWWKGANR